MSSQLCFGSLWCVDKTQRQRAHAKVANSTCQRQIEAEGREAAIIVRLPNNRQLLVIFFLEPEKQNDPGSEYGSAIVQQTPTISQGKPSPNRPSVLTHHIPPAHLQPYHITKLPYSSRAISNQLTPSPLLRAVFMSILALAAASLRVFVTQPESTTTTTITAIPTSYSVSFIRSLDTLCWLTSIPSHQFISKVQVHVPANTPGRLPRNTHPLNDESASIRTTRGLKPSWQFDHLPLATDSKTASAQSFPLEKNDSPIRPQDNPLAGVILQRWLNINTPKNTTETLILFRVDRQ
ncbi:hypothetical protein SODALDRAFT_359606 [Sodiomyces alkalinus F11]|uniref:Uncharacterized protein n=1 Tax=Sodiomyces alkalinus (strain CBS 110278 / VKM F-3762 / F11) TaxID=1314773 RepID=A0A3N2PVJ2_SODAK|nr:hypothetical protein SODALDRAFT_359606 [Sodiomyces alkalinus F11]ROT38510.1 hypothetical protein SODALDRAFT_359606 [Sodiomyces alkalinus F11]